MIVANEMSISDCSNILILKQTLDALHDTTVDYCGLSSQDDFHNFESILQFKYKHISSKQQLTKVCEFLTLAKAQVSYDWFLKIRPDIKLLEPLDFSKYSQTAMNARARSYKGPKKLNYGMSVNGKGFWETVRGCDYRRTEEECILDDQLYLFHKRVLDQGAFEPIKEQGRENEWFHTKVWKDRNIPLNIIGINVYLVKYNAFSGHLNLWL